LDMDQEVGREYKKYIIIYIETYIIMCYLYVIVGLCPLHQ